MENKGGKQRSVVNLKALNNFVYSGSLQDGRPPHSTGPDSDRGLYDQARSERCISPDPNPSGSLTSPPISVDGENISILMPSFRADLSSKVFTKVLKSLIGTLRQMGIRLVVYLDNILILHQGREELAPLICNLFEALGLVIDTMKFPNRAQNSWDFWYSQWLCKFRCTEAQQDARGLLHINQSLCRILARFVGKTTVSCKAIGKLPYIIG